MMDIEARRKRLATILGWGLGFAVAVGVAPFVYLAIKGLVGLVIAGALGFLAINLAPVFAMKVANWKMRLIVAEAEANPIETMRNLYIEKTTALEQADRDIEAFETEIGNFADQVVDFKRQYPEEAGKYDELLTRMREALADMKHEQSAARHELQRFAQQIKKAEAIYKMATAAARVTRLSRSAEAQVFAQIREQVALDSVRTQLNRAFAGLNTALERRADTRAALPAPAEVVNITPVTSNPARVRR